MYAPDILDRVLLCVVFIDVHEDFVSFSEELLEISSGVGVFDDFVNFGTFPVVFKAEVDEFSIIGSPFAEDRIFD